MKLLAFSVYDSKAELYSRPFFAQSRGMALRSVTDQVNDPEQELAKHAEDYTLFVCGAFDCLAGKFDAMVPVSLGNCVEFKHTQLPVVMREEA